MLFYIVQAVSRNLKACMGPYPGTESSIEGDVNVHINEETKDMTISYSLVGLEADVMGDMYIHTGTSCASKESVGGHFWNAGENGTISNPWTEDSGAAYFSTTFGHAVGEFTINNGFGYSEGNYGHAVVLYASNGTKIGCGILTNFHRSCFNGKKRLHTCIHPYPGTYSTIGGRVSVVIIPSGDMQVRYDLHGLEASVTGGAHIHEGTTCDDISLIGGHYWASGDDPWTPAVGAQYKTTTKGLARSAFTLNSGYNYAQNLGHALVIHDSTGSGVGCGVLSSERINCHETRMLEACITPVGPSTVSGKIMVNIDMKTLDMRFSFALDGLESNVIAETYIHTAYVCSEEMGGVHLWARGTDPWSPAYGAVYSTDWEGMARGNFIVNSGLGFASNLGHVAVVHASDGALIGCGVLSEFTTSCDVTSCAN